MNKTIKKIINGIAAISTVVYQLMGAVLLITISAMILPTVDEVIAKKIAWMTIIFAISFSIHFLWQGYDD